MTVDRELVEEIRNILSSGVRELDEAEARGVVEEVGRRFIRGTKKLWWWENLSVDSCALIYGDSDGLAMVSELLDDDESIWIVATDDECGPWPVWEGRASDIVEMLGNLRFFEYFILSREYQWIVFDTHHNTLVVVGETPGRVRSP